jgi:hypothetical protein
MGRSFSRQEIDKAYRRTCKQGCRTCGFTCPTDHVYTHVFTHCGNQVVHVLHDLEQRTVLFPRRKGYVVERRCLEFTGSGVLQVTCIKDPHDEPSHWGKALDGKDVVWQSVTIPSPVT